MSRCKHISYYSHFDLQGGITTTSFHVEIGAQRREPFVCNTTAISEKLMCKRNSPMEKKEYFKDKNPTLMPGILD